MKGAVLKRTPGSGSRSTKKKKDHTKLYTSPPKIAFRDPIGRELPASLHNFRWNVDKVERKLQEKIQEKTQIAGNFVYQQAYRLLEGNRGEGIDFPSFREQLRIKFGIILDDSELQVLFDKYDEDGNGTIDLHEFIRRVLPPDYNYGQQWFEVSQVESEEKAARMRNEARQEFLSCSGQIPENADATTSNWTIETLKKQIQSKVVQKTPSGEDQYRRAFKMLRTGRDQGIHMSGLQFNLKTKFGIYATDEQMRQLFLLCDQDSNGEIDLKEFLQFVDPPAYPANSRVPRGLWTYSDSEEEDDEEEDTESNGLGRVADVNVRERSSRLRVTPRPGSARPGSASSVIMEERVHSATRMKKERPKTADPRKTQMLQQRRELVDQQRIRNVAARQNLQQTCSMSMDDLHSQQLEALSLASEKRASGGRPPLTSRPASAYSGADTASVSGRSDAGYPPRPRSAGSVRSYGSSSSSVGSVSSSVRGAAYMKRPPTPQSLRQKCLESRGVSAAVAAEAQQKKKGVSLTPTHQQLSRLLPRDAERRHSFSDAPIAGAGKNVCTCSCSKKDQEEDDRYTNPPRLVRVHAKQYSTRPYTPTKAFSSSCRENR